jgi:hypothetical protein
MSMPSRIDQAQVSRHVNNPSFLPSLNDDRCIEGAQFVPPMVVRLWEGMEMFQ